jgi:signal transduction histidine kinase
MSVFSKHYSKKKKNECLEVFFNGLRKGAMGLIFTLIFSLAIWWLFIIARLEQKIDALKPYLLAETPSELLFKQSYLHIIKWEGATFFLLLIIVFYSFFRLLVREKKIQKSLSAFYAGVVHELKTPLTSLQLNAEYLASINTHQNLENAKRLLQDARRLEHALDNTLTLARIQTGKIPTLQKVNLKEVITLTHLKWCEDVSLEILTPENELLKKDQSYWIWGEVSLLEIIFRNLLQNSYKYHHQFCPIVKMTLIQEEKHCHLIYEDDCVFTGNLKDLGTIFSRGQLPHHNPQGVSGHGIGLYLVIQLMNILKGKMQWQLTSKNSLQFTLTWMRYVH